MNVQLSAELSELEELDDISADELDMTAASRSAIGLRCSSMPTFPEHQAIVLQSREADSEASRQDTANLTLDDSQVSWPVPLLFFAHAAALLCGRSCLVTHS